MDEKLFNLSKSYNNSCRYWDFNRYRIYLSTPLKQDLINYIDYLSFKEVNYAVYKLDTNTYPLDKTTVNFHLILKQDCVSLNIQMMGAMVDKKSFEKDFNILCSLDKQFSLIKTETDQSTAGPCSVCGTIDKWNSISDSKSYCYLHCKY